MLVQVVDRVDQREPVASGQASHVLLDLAELQGEGVLLLGGEALVAEHQHPMGEKRGSDRVLDVGRKRVRQVNPGDLRAGHAGEGPHRERRAVHH